MAFNLKKVLRALLFSTSQPLSIKDIQAAFTRYHEQASLSDEEGGEDVARLGQNPEASAESTTDAADAEGGSSPTANPVTTEASQPLVNDSGGTISAASADDLSGVQQGSPSETRASAEVSGDSISATIGGSTEPATTEFPPEEAELYQDVPSLITAAQIREAMDQIALELRSEDSGLLLVEAGEGYRLVTHPRFARWVRILRNEPPPAKLTQSVLETLAVIAYRQPVTRTEIEHIRGVSAEASLNKLLERELIYIVGRADLPGRPLQYGTTDRFLEFLGVRSLDELPASDVLSHKQIDEWLQNNTNAKPPTDADMGLPLELGEGESPNFEQVEVAKTDEAQDSARAAASSETRAETTEGTDSQDSSAGSIPTPTDSQVPLQTEPTSGGVPSVEEHPPVQ